MHTFYSESLDVSYWAPQLGSSVPFHVWVKGICKKKKKNYTMVRHKSEELNYKEIKKHLL